MKIDHQLAERWIKPNAKVLDLGCGNGDLLAHLQNKLGVFGYGIEIDQTKINDCIIGCDTFTIKFLLYCISKISYYFSCFILSYIARIIH